MDRSDIVTKIEAATLVIRDAEENLQQLVADGTIARVDEDAEDIERVVRTATARLRFAEAKLADLERLLPLAKIDSGETIVDGARSVVKAAEQELIRVLDQMAVTEPLRETWVTEIVESAFTRLRTARKTLADLEESVAAGEA